MIDETQMNVAGGALKARPETALEAIQNRLSGIASNLREESYRAANLLDSIVGSVPSEVAKGLEVNEPANKIACIYEQLDSLDQLCDLIRANNNRLEAL